MDFFKYNPFVRFIIPLIFGILLQYYLSANLIIILSLSSIILITIILLPISLSFNKQYIKGILINLSIVIYGMLITFFKDNEYQKIDITNSPFLIGKLIDVPKDRGVDYKLNLIIEAQKKNDKWQSVKSKVIVYLKKDSTKVRLNVGDRIVFSAKVPLNFHKKNPFDFNYGKYLMLRHIKHVFYVKNNEIVILHNNRVSYKKNILGIRNKIINIYRQSGIKDDNLAVLSALSLGYKDYLSPNIRQAYIGAGAMHILAVSGLHIGIVYLILYILFSWLILIFPSKRIFYTVVLLFLWVYAFLTGLSPSVFRATVMFTFILIGFVINKKLNIYNSLAASGFFLLLINPFLLFDISFQLSYIAVLGIVFFYPRIYKIIYFKNKILRQIWSLTSVSIAAQIATFPITIYYFNIFPTYFWLSNIIATIFAIILISLSFVLILLSIFPKIVLIIGAVLNTFLNINIDAIRWINNLPYSLIVNISISKIYILALYILILSFVLWIILKNYKSLIFILLSVIFIGVLRDINYFKRYKQQVLCIYEIKKGMAIHFIDSNKSYWLLSDNKNKEIKQLVNKANNYWCTDNNTYYNISDTIIENNNFYYNNGFFIFNDKTGILIAENSYNINIPKAPITLDYLITKGNKVFKYKNKLSNIKFNNIIDYNKGKYNLKAEESFKTEIYSIKEKGAFMWIN